MLHASNEMLISARKIDSYEYIIIHKNKAVYSNAFHDRYM